MGLLNKNNIKGVREYISILMGMGYDTYIQPLSGLRFGVPQDRRRVFIVSVKSGEIPYKFPSGWKLTKRVLDIMENEEDLPDSAVYTRVHDGREDVSRIELRREFSEIVPDVVAFLHENPRHHPLTYKVFNPYGACRTILCSGRMHGAPKFVVNRHGKQVIRPITPREAWRLMGIDDSYFDIASELVSESALYRQVGNAIIVPVLGEILRNIQSLYF